MRVKDAPSARGSTWTDRDTEQTFAQQKNSSGGNVSLHQKPAIEERPRQRSVSSDLEDGDLASEEEFNPTHSHFVSVLQHCKCIYYMYTCIEVYMCCNASCVQRASSGESFYIESRSPEVENALRSTGA